MCFMSLILMQIFLSNRLNTWTSVLIAYSVSIINFTNGIKVRFGAFLILFPFERFYEMVTVDMITFYMYIIRIWMHD